MADVLASLEASKGAMDSSKSALKTKETTVEELCQSRLNSAAETIEFFLQRTRASEEDEELVAVARRRLQETGPIRVKLEEL